jgi:hypothetical protein
MSRYARLLICTPQFDSNELSRMVDYRVFGYRRIKVLRPLRMALAHQCDSLKSSKGEGLGQAHGRAAGRMDCSIATAHWFEPALSHGPNLL